MAFRTYDGVHTNHIESLHKQIKTELDKRRGHMPTGVNRIIVAMAATSLYRFDRIWRSVTDGSDMLDTITGENPLVSAFKVLRWMGTEGVSLYEPTAGEIAGLPSLTEEVDHIFWQIKTATAHISAAEPKTDEEARQLRNEVSRAIAAVPNQPCPTIGHHPHRVDPQAAAGVTPTYAARYARKSAATAAKKEATTPIAKRQKNAVSPKVAEAVSPDAVPKRRGRPPGSGKKDPNSVPSPNEWASMAPAVDHQALERLKLLDEQEAQRRREYDAKMEATISSRHYQRVGDLEYTPVYERCDLATINEPQPPDTVWASQPMFPLPSAIAAASAAASASVLRKGAAHIISKSLQYLQK